MGESEIRAHTRRTGGRQGQFNRSTDPYGTFAQEFGQLVRFAEGNSGKMSEGELSIVRELKELFIGLDPDSASLVK